MTTGEESAVIHPGDCLSEYRRCKYLKFSMNDLESELQCLGCIGSLGTLRKLYFIDGDGNYARFILYTDEGVYGLDTVAYEPGFQAMRFLSAWREDVSEGDYSRVLFFDPQVVASIEKAGLSFANYSRIGECKVDSEIELMGEYAAIDYLKNAKEFHVDTWPIVCLERILWCDKNFRPLCEKRMDFASAAAFDYGLWSVLAASHPTNDDGGWGDAELRAFFGQRYGVYASARNGVVSQWEDWH